MNEIVQHTPITPRQYLEDFYRFGIRNHWEAVKALTASWAFISQESQLLRGAKVFQEYGAAIEELFAHVYAAHKQSTETEIVFLEHFLGYGTSQLNAFRREHDFSKEICDLLSVPEPHLMARRFGVDTEYYLQSLSELGQLLEDLKTELFEDSFILMYNKLKHGFPVLSPELAPGEKPMRLGLLLELGEGDQVAVGRPFSVDLQSLSQPISNIFAIMCCTGVVIRTLIYQCEIRAGGESTCN